MNKLEYLKKLKEKKDFYSIYQTWLALGAPIVSESTRVYNKDTLYKVFINVDSEAVLHEALVWCSNSYSVNPTLGFNQVNWATAQVSDVDNNIYFYQGVASPNFEVLGLAEDFTNIDKAEDINFIPFDSSKVHSASISISDEEYAIIAAELGVPFLHEDELEYNRDTIIDICIKPALDTYYSYFPIVIDEVVNGVGAGAWEYEYHIFPEDPTVSAYKALPYTTGTGAGTGIRGRTSPFSFMIEQGSTGGAGFSGMGGQFGGGVRYRKSVPGFTGGATGVDAGLLAMSAGKSMANLYDRQYSRDVYVFGKKYIRGFNSLGGAVNIHWLCMSNDFSRVEYYMLPQVRKLCTAYALRNIGMLRALVTSDAVNKIDYSLYTQRADTLEQEVLESWKNNSSTLRFAVRSNKGGIGFGIGNGSMSYRTRIEKVPDTSLGPSGTSTIQRISFSVGD